ncbi:MAG: hypothetical protein VB087_05875 [Candidatus Limiplasma sp.]|nr:hypothetical protein [Candidatus Limiplasma sp.]
MTTNTNDITIRQQSGVDHIYKSLYQAQKDLLNKYRETSFCYLLLSAHNISSGHGRFSNLLLTNYGYDLSTLEIKLSTARTENELALLRYSNAQENCKTILARQKGNGKTSNTIENSIKKAQGKIESARKRVLSCQDKITTQQSKLNEYIAKLSKMAEQPHDHVSFYYEDDRLVVYNETK